LGQGSEQALPEQTPGHRSFELKWLLDGPGSSSASPFPYKSQELETHEGNHLTERRISGDGSLARFILVKQNKVRRKQGREKHQLHRQEMGVKKTKLMALFWGLHTS
jgi:hypothetical protein